jgi:hypothetical protein
MMTNKFDNLTSLTALEKQMILRVGEDAYMNGDPEGSTWAWSPCGTKAEAAVWGSLVKKGYGWSSRLHGESQLGLSDKGVCGLLRASAGKGELAMATETTSKLFWVPG